MEIYKKLEDIQKNLNAPKSQYNKFGKYSYRNCEDILQAVKPLLDGCVVLITDKIVNVGNRFYVEATARITDGKDGVEVSAYAREDETKKGMDLSQLTGSTSSYARKYALNGLFLIDDNKDADSDKPTKESGPIIDEMAREWIAACTADPTAIQQIADPKYKSFIIQQMKAIP